MHGDPLGQRPFDSAPLPDRDLIVNTEPRCPCLLLLDTSHSMNGEPIRELNNGLITLRDELQADSLAAKRVEIAMLTFGPVKVETDFVSAQTFSPPTLAASGDTPLCQAIDDGVKLLRTRKDAYRASGTAYYRPWIFLVTDGAPTDPQGRWGEAAELIRKGEEEKGFMFFAVGVEQANLEALRFFCPPSRPPLKLKGLMFREMFRWLTGTFSRISRSTPGDGLPLDNPAAPDGWGKIG